MSLQKEHFFENLPTLMSPSCLTELTLSLLGLGLPLRWSEPVTVWACLTGALYLTRAGAERNRVMQNNPLAGV